jgi:hypothetical protein
VMALMRSPITMANGQGRLAFGLSWFYLDTRFPAVSSLPSALTLAITWQRPLGPNFFWRSIGAIAINGVGAPALAVPLESSVTAPIWRWGGPQIGIRILYLQAFSNGGGSPPSFLIPSAWAGLRLEPDF